MPAIPVTSVRKITGDDHLHQLDERIAQRLERRAVRRIEMPERCAQRDRDQHLDIELAGPALARRRLRDAICLGWYGQHRLLKTFVHCHGTLWRR